MVLEMSYMYVYICIYMYMRVSSSFVIFFYDRSMVVVLMTL